MARGQSGRLVLEIDPKFKRLLHGKLAAEGRTMKDWFLEQAERYLRTAVEQLQLLPQAAAATSRLPQKKRACRTSPTGEA